MKLLATAAAILLLCGSAVAADGPCVVPGRGHFQIQVGTGGLFGAFAHDHLIDAQSIEGCATVDSKDLSHSSIKLSFKTAALKVIDPKEKADDRAKVQKTMETDVLRVSEFPVVTFASTAIEKTGSQLKVSGTLTIRGKAQLVTIPVSLTELSGGMYRAVGSYKFRQTAFGIKPIQLAGGSIKVKDELQADFELFLK